MCGYESRSVRPQLDSCSDPVDELQVFLKRLRQATAGTRPPGCRPVDPEVTSSTLLFAVDNGSYRR